MWQTQSVWPVRTAHIRVLLTVNIVSHNPAQSSLDNIPFNLQSQWLGCCLAEGSGERQKVGSGTQFASGHFWCSNATASNAKIAKKLKFLGSQPAGYLIINPVVGFHYFPTGPTVTFPTKETTPLGQYQIMVLGDRGTPVQVACPRPLYNGAQTRLEPATRESQVRGPANNATASLHSRANNLFIQK